jgi:Spy/CpxP family protein refolding chaperone
MKTFSFAAFVVLLAVMLVIPVKAQMGRMSIDDRVKLLEKELTLTKEQVDSIKVIMTVAQEKTKALRDATPDADPQVRREEMMKLRQESDKQVEKLLTAEQKKKYDEIKKERMKMRGPGGPGGPSGPGSGKPE